ncbi:hypothetical protein KOI35_18420 [Actinoplanes bogorensis]|uniref:Uncharacterized protein n=1 Tax=Paractinoplanes bogorensis TaxID=1610840 RepID=A0ABS5YPW3_9ACTN|nr:hypothetical protein [Actinoplanes bogorensis]MBU2665486.1 hypothetical protein [Actinoplanes bogorensis]
MASADDLSDEANWRGGFYELSLDLGAADDHRAERALQALWRAADVHGCHDRLGLADSELSLAGLREHDHLCGTVTLPSGRRSVCGAFLTRYDEDDTDELELYLPMGALARTDRRIGGFPFSPGSGPETLRWRADLDRWLAGIATAVHTQVPLRRAHIGFELDDHSIATGYAAILTPATDGLSYQPATT